MSKQSDYKDNRKKKGQCRYAGSVTVIGAGVTGLSAAHELAARNFKVEVIEQAGEESDVEVGGLAATQWWDVEEDRYRDAVRIAFVPFTETTDDLKADSEWLERVKKQVENATENEVELTLTQHIPEFSIDARDFEVHRDTDGKWKLTDGMMTLPDGQESSEVNIGTMGRWTVVHEKANRKSIFGAVKLPPDAAPKSVPAQNCTPKGLGLLREHSIRALLESKNGLRLVRSGDHWFATETGKTIRFRSRILVSDSIDPTSASLTVTVGPRVPGEHGYRFFPAFYRNLFDTMKRTPILSDTAHRSAFDMLTPTTLLALSDPDHKLVPLIRRRPHSLEEIRSQFRMLLDELHYTTEDILRFELKMFRFLTTSRARRRTLEDRSAWDYMDGDLFSPIAQVRMRHSPQALVAMFAETSDARTHAVIMAQLLLDGLGDGSDVDMTLQGPTSEVWLDPWKEYLESQGVTFRRAAVESFLENGDELETWLRENGRLEKYEPPSKKNKDKAKQDECTTGDKKDDDDEFLGRKHYYIVAADLRSAKKITRNLAGQREACAIQELAAYEVNPDDTPEPPDAPLRTLTGVQFYFNRTLDIFEGHVYFHASPWGLSSISQQQFWAHGSSKGGFRTVLSVDIGRANFHGYNGKTLWECDQREIVHEVWNQIARSLSTKRSHLPRWDSAHVDTNLLFERFDRFRYRIVDGEGRVSREASVTVRLTDEEHVRERRPTFVRHEGYTAASTLTGIVVQNDNNTFAQAVRPDFRPTGIALFVLPAQASPATQTVDVSDAQAEAKAKATAPTTIRMAVGSDQGSIHIYESKGGPFSEIKKLPKQKPDLSQRNADDTVWRMTDAHFFDNGKDLLALYGGGWAIFREWKTGDETESDKWTNGAKLVSTVRDPRDPRDVFVGLSDGHVGKLRLREENSKPIYVRGHTGPVNAIAANGTTAWTCAEDGTCVEWVPTADNLQKNATVRVGCAVSAIAIVSDNHVVYGVGNEIHAVGGSDHGPLLSFPTAVTCLEFEKGFVNKAIVVGTQGGGVWACFVRGDYSHSEEILHRNDGIEHQFRRVLDGETIWKRERLWSHDAPVHQLLRDDDRTWSASLDGEIHSMRSAGEQLEHGAVVPKPSIQRFRCWQGGEVDVAAAFSGEAPVLETFPAYGRVSGPVVDQYTTPSFKYRPSGDFLGDDSFVFSQKSESRENRTNGGQPNGDASLPKGIDGLAYNQFAHNYNSSHASIKPASLAHFTGHPSATFASHKITQAQAATETGRTDVINIEVACPSEALPKPIDLQVDASIFDLRAGIDVLLRAIGPHEGGPFRYEITEPPTRGTVMGDAPRIRYTARKSGKNRLARNLTPFQVNNVGDFAKRPGRLPEYEERDPHHQGTLDPSYVEHNLYKGIVLAGTYMKTFTRLTTMEAANESAKHAVNIVLQDVMRRDGFVRPADECKIYDPEQHEFDDLKWLKDIDRQLYEAGMPHFIDILGLDDLPQLWFNDGHHARKMGGLAAVIKALPMGNVLKADGLVKMLGGKDEAMKKVRQLVGTLLGLSE